jgi:AcrR family transcriptional regulator
LPPKNTVTGPNEALGVSVWITGARTVGETDRHANPVIVRPARPPALPALPTVRTLPGLPTPPAGPNARPCPHLPALPAPARIDPRNDAGLYLMTERSVREMNPPDTTTAESPHAPRWERRKESRPAELLAAALDLFVERGYAATRLDDIASRAGVSKGTLYLYFANKEELFKALVRENIVVLLDRFRREIADSDASASALIEQFLRSWWRDFGATRLAGIAKLIMAEAGNFPEVARFFHDEVIQPNGELLGSIIGRGVERGEFRPVDVEAAAQLFLCSEDSISATRN